MLAGVGKTGLGNSMVFSLEFEGDSVADVGLNAGWVINQGTIRTDFNLVVDDLGTRSRSLISK